MGISAAGGEYCYAQGCYEGICPCLSWTVSFFGLPKALTEFVLIRWRFRLVSVARGEQDYFSPDGIPTATEGCRSNALMRCCKDLGIASELWDPRWIRTFKAKYTREVFVEHIVNKRKTKIWVRKDDGVNYPWKETGSKN